ncbi:MAG TPA: beta-ketoacyl reductase, partial [Kofleriaceae bacterium]|nr:beta-ketoacyl reductase [Kofleriaceae bacterium]
RWLVEHGARRLVLAGRSAPTEAARALARTLEQRGAAITLATADVAQRTDVERLLREASALAPLRGVFHLAGVLDDALLAQQDAARFRRVMAPKLEGAWHLHQLTQDLELDCFVLYSSIAALVGSPGQTNYAAANSFLDALVAHRRARGLPGQSLQWGPISEIGLAAAADSRGERLQDRGMASMSPAAAEAILASILARDEVCAGIVSLDVGRWLDFYPTLSASAFFGDLIGAAAAASAASSSAPAHHALIDRLRASPAQLRIGQLEDLVRRQLARVLQCRPEALTAHAAFSSVGLESLTGLELRNRIEAETGLRLPATIIWARGNIASLAHELRERLFPDGDGAVHGAAPRDAERAVVVAPSEEELLADLARALDEVEASNLHERGK